MTAKNVVEPQTAEDQSVVTVDSYIPDLLGHDSVTVITSTYDEADAWGAIPASQDEIDLLLKGIKL